MPENVQKLFLGAAVAAIIGAALWAASTSKPSEVAAPDALAEQQGYTTDTSARTADADAEIQKQDLARPRVSIMALALALEFEQNEVVANDKYTDRRIVITGTVSSIDDADQFGNPPVAWLQTNPDLPDLGVIVPRDEAATLQKYRVATFDCYGAQKRVRVMAKGCRIHTPDSLPALPAG